MNAPFLRLLHSLAWTEKEPSYKPARYDIPKLSFETVLTVVNPTGRHPEPSPGECRMSSITAAIEHCAELRRSTHVNSFSILVHEGLYVDAIPSFFKSFRGQFSLEIVGVGDVRLVFLSDEPMIHISGSGRNIILKNVRIYNRKYTRKFTSFQVWDGAKAKLVNVGFNCPSANGVQMRGAGSLVEAESCTFYHCLRGFCIEIGGKLILKDTVVREVPKEMIHCLRSGSSLEAVNCRFLRVTQVCIDQKSQGRFDSCEFVGRWDPARNHPDMAGASFSDQAIDVNNGSTLSLTKCSFASYGWGILTTALGTSATVNKCSFDKDISKAFSVAINSSLVVHDTRIMSPIALGIGSLGKGKIEMKRNKFPSSRPKVTMFQKQINEKINFIHDFKRPPEILLSKEKEIMNGKDRSKFTKKTRAAGLRWDDVADDDVQGALFKQCENCGVHEGDSYQDQFWRMGQDLLGKMDDILANLEDGHEETEEEIKARQAWGDEYVNKWDAFGEEFLEGNKKFKYCQYCKLICYCSRKCQVENWPDHKLVCPGLEKKKNEKNRDRASELD